MRSTLRDRTQQGIWPRRGWAHIDTTETGIDHGTYGGDLSVSGRPTINVRCNRLMNESVKTHRSCPGPPPLPHGHPPLPTFPCRRPHITLACRRCSDPGAGIR